MLGEVLHSLMRLVSGERGGDAGAGSLQDALREELGPSSKHEGPAGMSLGTARGMGSRGPFLSFQQLWRTANKIPQAIPVPDACHLNDA